ncbi:MAG: hypothetical protein R2731_18525 [Nocardioides sp.]
MTDAYEAVRLAQSAFRLALGDAQAHLARVAATPVHTPEQRAELERDARSGRLGPQMQTIAEKVDARETSWGEVFEGSSPYSDLLLPHLSAMEERYAEVWKAALEADPDFEPLVGDGGPDRPGPRVEP